MSIREENERFLSQKARLVGRRNEMATTTTPTGIALSPWRTVNGSHHRSIIFLLVAIHSSIFTSFHGMPKTKAKSIFDNIDNKKRNECNL